MDWLTITFEFPLRVNEPPNNIVEEELKVREFEEERVTFEVILYFPEENDILVITLPYEVLYTQTPLLQ